MDAAFPGWDSRQKEDEDGWGDPHLQFLAAGRGCKVPGWHRSTEMLWWEEPDIPQAPVSVGFPVLGGEELFPVGFFSAGCRSGCFRPPAIRSGRKEAEEWPTHARLLLVGRSSFPQLSWGQGSSETSWSVWGTALTPCQQRCHHPQPKGTPQGAFPLSSGSCWPGNGKEGGCWCPPRAPPLHRGCQGEQHFVRALEWLC